jgi:UDP-N-acetylglucosamine 2-epimerase
MKPIATRTRERANARPLVVSVFGTRPQLVKLSAMWKPLDEAFRSYLVDSGQHYDFSLAGAFYSGWRLRRPDAFLNARADTPTRQISRIADALDDVLRRKRPAAVIVYGDTSTTAGAAIAAAYRNVPVAHVEAGLRSFDMTAAEEKNRILTDHLATWLFCPTGTAIANLKNEGIRHGVSGVGDILYQSFLLRKRALMHSDALREFGLQRGNYFFFTCHRAETVDNPERLRLIVELLQSLPGPVLFPVHPRTKRELLRTRLWQKLQRSGAIHPIAPIDHDTTLSLISQAGTVITDSGGVQREAYWCGTPCLTLRDRTEWVELVECGANRLVGQDAELVRRSLRRSVKLKRMTDPYFRRRNASEAIVRILEHRLR